MSYLGFDGHPTELYVKADPHHVLGAARIILQKVDPASPSTVSVSQPSAALTAQAEANSAFTNLFIGLGAVALLVGAIGVANIMVIAVLERRGEIGLRRALVATRAHIRNQFLGEEVVLSLVGGSAEIVAGAIVTAVYASMKGWLIVVPPLAWSGGIGAALVIGGIAGFLPARRADELSPTEALRSV